MLAKCRTLGIVTAAFYVLGFAEDTPESVRATIDYSLQLGSTVAQFKILTPYPGTPLYARMETAITERDWEQFDGFTPTFTPPAPVAHRAAASCSAAPTRASTSGRRSWRTTCGSARRR